jgi:ABC-2 type transport system permease protein
MRKEFKQIFRNRTMLPIIFVMPMLQLVILVAAATLDVKNLNIAIADFDKSSSSRLLINKISGSGYFKVSEYTNDRKMLDESINKRESDLYLEIPKNFESDLVRESKNNVQASFNSVDGSKAGLAMGYLSAILADFNKETIENFGIKTVDMSALNKLKSIDIRENYWYNPELKYSYFMAPGIIGLLVTMIGGFLSGMNVVRENELGSIEQLNVTPIKKIEFIIGKLMPLWFIAMFELCFGLGFSMIVYGVPFLGHFSALALFTGVYLFAMLGMGLLIATMTGTQQQAMFLTWFFMVIFILLSGFFTPIENMPDWTQKITLLNPIRYFVDTIRSVMLKGSGLVDIANNLYCVAAMAIVLVSLAVLRYKKTN